MNPNLQIKKLLLASVLVSYPVFAGDGFFEAMQTSAAVDLVSATQLDGGRDRDHFKPEVRSAELIFFSPIDHTFDGVLNIAGHAEEGDFSFELHEAYFGSSKLIPRSRFRAGKFFLGLGRLNQFHQHDWPMVSAPKVQREFFADEGTADVGVEYSYLVPSSVFLDLTVGLTRGYCYGHCHGDGVKPPAPTFYLHPTIFLEGSSSGSGTLLGLNYLKRRDGSTSINTQLFGLDATFKKRNGKTLKWLMQGEVFYEVNEGGLNEKRIGAYFYPQYGFNESWSFGLRFDAFSHLNKKFESDGSARPDLDYGFVPTLTYRNSEFAVFKLAYSHEVDTTGGIGDIKNRQILLQATFMLGAHPAHEF